MYFRTGPAKCEERCIVMSDNPDLEPENNAIVVTEPGTEVVVRPVALGSCQVTIMVVGGGGAIPDHEVQPSNGSYGGGGSGHFQTTTFNLTGSLELRVMVGGGGESTTVSWPNGSVMALPGEPANGQPDDHTNPFGYGGNGWCGGGGGGTLHAGDGGTGGGDGDYGSSGGAGRGTGIDVGEIQIPNFTFE
jgi:hypothetical protein